MDGGVNVRGDKARDSVADQEGVSALVNKLMPGLGLLRHYERGWLRSDVTAGLSVAAIALPVGIAYADLAGVPAVVGMYSAIFPLLAYALFGSSRQLMTGPDAATCIIAAAALGPLAGGDPERYLALMVLLSLMTGLIYIVAGIARLGFIANFLSQPILTGYLNGIALIIVAGQLQKLFGYSGEADTFFPKLTEFVRNVSDVHMPTLTLGMGLLAGLLVLRYVAPRLPAALIVVVIGIGLVMTLDLEQIGVAIIGSVPAGLPVPGFDFFDPAAIKRLLGDAAGIVLVSFTSGVLTAKSFAQRNGYEIDANRELIAFGAGNIASGLAQGFPVTGADSRTAVNDAMGGKTQLVGVVAAASMLLILFFATGPLAYVPAAALAAVILVAAMGLFDFAELRSLYEISHRELFLSLATTIGVLILGVLPGVLLAVTLSLLWLLTVVSKPHDGVLGRVKGIKGFHNLNDFPEARTIPGLILYRFDSNLMFFNVDYFCERVRAAIAKADTPVEWVIVDASSINVVDITAVQRVDALRDELAARGIVLALARVKLSLNRFFSEKWSREHSELHRAYRFYTLNSALRAFNKRHKSKTGRKQVDASD